MFLTENLFELNETVKAILIIIACFVIPYLFLYLMPFKRKFSRGLRAYRKMDYSSAHDIFSECIKRKPSYPGSYINRSFSSAFLKNYDEAISDSLKAVKLKPDDYRVFTVLPMIYSELKNYDLALYYIDKAINLNPPRRDKSVLLSQRGCIWLNKKELFHAEKDFKDSLELMNNSSATFNNLGYILLLKDKPKDAISYLNRAIELDKKDPFAYNNRGYAYANLGESDKAFVDFKRSFELDPNNPYLFKFRGFTYYKLKKYSESLADLEKSLHLKPDFEDEILPIIEEIKAKM